MPRALASSQLIRSSYPNSWGSSDRTFMIVCKRSLDSAGANAALFAGLSSGDTAEVSLYLNGTDSPTWAGSAATSAPTMTVRVADGWVCLVVTKTAGTSTPRFHKFVYSTGVWSHENASAAVGDQAGTTVGSVLWGRTGPATTANSWSGSLAATALWIRALTDAEIESAAESVSAMQAHDPTRGLWLFDYAAAGGTHELYRGSTSVSDTSTLDGDGCPFSYGRPVAYEEVVTVGPQEVRPVSIPSAAGFGTATATATATAGEATPRFVEVKQPVRVSPGQVWTAMLEARSTAVAAEICLHLKLFAGAVQVGTVHLSDDDYVSLTDAWLPVSFSYAVPNDGSVTAILLALGIAPVPEGAQTKFRNVALIATSADVAGYFDGDTLSETADYFWSSTPHYSRSYFYGQRTLRAHRLRNILPRFLPAGTEFDFAWGQADGDGYGVPWGIESYALAPSEVPLADGTLLLNLKWRFQLTYDDVRGVPTDTYNVLLSRNATYSHLFVGPTYSYTDVLSYETYAALAASPEANYQDLKDGPS